MEETVPKEKPKEETVPAVEKPIPKEEHPDDKIDRANAAAKRMEEANKRHEELIQRQERLAVEDKLGGRSEVTIKKTKEDEDKEAARALIPEGMPCKGVNDE